MGSISIRNVDERVAKKLKQQAKKSKKSVNQLVLEILSRHVGLEKEQRFTRTFDDLDMLFGRWSEADYKYIQGRINEERRIDEELWEPATK